MTTGELQGRLWKMPQILTVRKEIWKMKGWGLRWGNDDGDSGVLSQLMLPSHAAPHANAPALRILCGSLVFLHYQFNLTSATSIPMLPAT